VLKQIGLIKITGLCLAVLFLLLGLTAPAFHGLSPMGSRTIWLTLFFLILLITEAIPLITSCLLTIGLMPILGITERISGAFVGFSHPVIFFIISSFGIAAAISSVPITKRILFMILKNTKNKITHILFAMMCVTAITSFFMSNVPACAIMMILALELVESIDNEAQRKSIGRLFMIAIPVATMIGGIATPASSSLNLLALSLLEQHTGITIGFVQWMALGVPMVVILIPIAWWIMVRVYKPVHIDESMILKFKEDIAMQVKRDGNLEWREVYVAGILAIMLILWIASTWIPSIEIFTVALMGCVALLLPGKHILPINTFVKSINMNVIFISGAILSIAALLVDHGVSLWLAEMVHQLFIPENVHLVVFMTAIIAFTGTVFITSAPALITVLAVPLMSIAFAGGIPLPYVIFVLAVCAGNCYLFPLDTVQLVTYSKGYYKMTDMAKSTLFLQIIIVILLALWIPLMGGFLNI